MRTTLRLFAIVGGCCFGLLTWPEQACSQGFYLDADAGVSFAEDVKLRRFLVPTPGAKLKFYPGPRLSVAGGYSFNDYVGVQLETGLIHNEVKSVTGGGNIDASLGHVPVLADVVVRYDKPDFQFVPYAGAGAGADVSVLYLDNVRAPNGGRVDGTGSTAVFAWQAFAGARYKFNDKMSIGAGYKFYFADEASWEVRRTSDDIKAGTARVHSVVADFNLKF